MPSASMSVCGPFKRNAWDSSCPPSHSATISAGFYSQKLGGLLSLTLVLWAGEPGVGLGLLTSWEEGASAAEISLLIFNGYTQVWDQPVLHLCPSCQSSGGFFFMSLVVGL